MVKITVKKIIKAFAPYGLIVFYKYYCQKKKQSIKNSNYFTWEMTENEQELFKKYIYSSKVYLEFGSGGSTIAALINSDRKIYSIESSKDWIEKMKQKYEIILKGEKSGQLNLIHVDIGKTGNWGVPIMITDDNKTDKFLNYSQSQFERHREMKMADFVLIDGRFRVACCLKTLLETGENTVIMFHDFWNRPQYHIIKKYVNIIDGIDTLMICKKKYNISDDEIRNEYDNYKYNYE
jgi:hypothetical protein